MLSGKLLTVYVDDVLTATFQSFLWWMLSGKLTSYCSKANDIIRVSILLVVDVEW